VKTRVLIADANRSLSDIYDRFLAGFGCHVETVSGGVDCMAKLPSFLPDVLILDLRLPWGGAHTSPPGGTGGVLARLSEAGDAPVPAVILIGDAAPSTVTEIILKSPFVRVYHQKPIPPSELLDAIGELAQRQRGRGPALVCTAMNQGEFRMHTEPVSEELGRTPRPESECVEMPLLLPEWQLAALDTAAATRELTIGQLLRQLIGTYVTGLSASRVRKDNHCNAEHRGAVHKGVHA